MYSFVFTMFEVNWVLPTRESCGCTIWVEDLCYYSWQPVCLEDSPTVSNVGDMEGQK